jgi:hypothetical protein
MNQPAILSITPHASGFRYILIPPGDVQAGRGGAMPPFDVKVDTAVISLLCKRFASAVDAVVRDPLNPQLALQPFVDVGRALFAALFPQSLALQGLRKALGGLCGNTPLLIVTEKLNIPLECLLLNEEDGKSPQFLGACIDVGRSLIAQDVPNWPRPKQRDQWRALLIGNPTCDLDPYTQEVQQLEKWFRERGIDSTVLLESDANYEAVVGALLEEWDIIHYCGHVEMQTSSLILHGGETLSPLALQPLVRGAPIVFLNGCGSARVVEELTGAFLRGGAQAVVGSQFQHAVSGASAFSRRYYDEVLSGKTLGESMRLARSELMGRPECTAAWAYFVLYGDPCLRVRLRPDSLATVLREEQLPRSSFDAAARRLIDYAFQLGHQTGEVGSMSLFAALLCATSPMLRDRLSHYRTPADQLEALIRQELTKGSGKTESGSPEKVSLSEHARQILHKASELASGEITELDIMKAFARTGGGGAGDVLRKLRVCVEALDPDVQFPPPVNRIGTLSPQDCTPGAWAALKSCADLAAQFGYPVVSTGALLAGLAHDPQGYCAERTKKLSYELTTRTLLPRVAPPRLLIGDVACSRNAGEILLRAQSDSAAANRLVDEPELLNAFVQSGGGATGQQLAEKGFVLNLLVSELFQTGGALDVERLSQAAQKIMNGAVEFASQHGFPTVNRDHMAYSMISHGACFTQWLQGQGIEPEQAANVIFADLTRRGSTSRTALALKVSSFSPNLVSVLCEAERTAEKSELIEEAGLLKAWASGGGGRVGRLLVKQGVSLLKLIQ